MKTFRMLARSLGLLGALTAPFAAGAGVQEEIVGSVSENARYVVSPHGLHMAVVANKGSRLSVLVDGLAGPRIDAIVEPTWAYVDPRPYQGMDGNSVPRPAPVSFSKDGRRHAYIGRLGQEWVLMADGKEVLRLPASGAVGAASGIAGAEGNTEIRLEFSGEDGRHLLFARSIYGGNELWVDGQKWPGLFGSGGGGTDGTIDPIISADGEHIAYVAQISRDKRALIVDGKDAGYFGGHLQFTPDSKHLLCIATTPKGQSVLLDGKPIFSARQIQQVHVPPAGTRLIFALTHFSPDGASAQGTFLVVDGKPVEATLTANAPPPRVIFSPDGKHYAAVCGDSPNRFVVTDGKKGQEYFIINDRDVSTFAQGIAFSPDSSKLVYIASTSVGGTNSYVVINGEESDGLINPWFRFSADGRHLAYGGALDQAQQKYLLMIDGKRLPLPPGWSVSSFTFSPDGSRHAFLGTQGGNKGIYLDGKNTELTGDFAFSPDSRRFAVVGFRAADNKSGLFVDGQHVFESYDKPLERQAFTADGQHLIWTAREPATGPNATPGTWEHVTYVDGNPVARHGVPPTVLASSFNQFGRTSWKTPHSWRVNPAGALMLLAPAGDDVKRLTITPPAETSVDTMIAEAKAAPERAAAKAAEEKKKAAEAAAAKKAKADADAAEAAAKAKAEYDARVAKQKADYEAALAKRKADYEAAVAKQKADYEALMAKRKADAEAAAAARKK